MITTISLNPSIDRTVDVQGFTIGATNRVLSEGSLGAGKAVNVAIVARRLSMETTCIGLLAQEKAQPVIDRLQADAVTHAFVRTPGAVRVNVKIRDRDNGTITELNEPGSVTPAHCLEELTALLLKYALLSDYLVLTGSLPPGCPPDQYRQWMRAVGPPCRCVLDVDGNRLMEDIVAAPYLIKPNLQELEAAAGQKLTTLRDVRAQAFRMIDKGVKRVAVSMGGEGALLTDGSTTLFAPRVQVKTCSTVCAGDSMVAGMLYGLSHGEGLKDVLRYGVAAATATVANDRDGLMTYEDFQAVLPRIKLGAV